MLKNEYMYFEDQLYECVFGCSAQTRNKDCPFNEAHHLPIKEKVIWIESLNTANELLKQMLVKYSNVVYVDVTTPGVSKDGRPRPEIYRADSLHLNRTGYEMWGNILRPLLTVNKQ